MYPCLASSGLDMPLDFSLDFPLDFALDGCDFGVISQIKALNPLVATDSALLNLANVGRPIPQRTVRDFNGTTQYATKGVSNYRSGDASGAIEITFSTTVTGSTLTFFSSGDNSSSSNYLNFGIREGGKIFVAMNTGSTSAIRTFNTFADGLTHTAKITSNGTSWSIEVDGVVQTIDVFLGTNTGDWFGDIPNRDNLNVGVLKRDTSAAFFNGTISQVSVYDPNGAVVNQWELVENGGSVMRDALGVHDLTYINNPVVTTDNTVASDPLNERGFTEGTGFGGTSYTTNPVSNYRSGDASGAIEVTFSTTATGTNIILNSSNDVAGGDNLAVGIREGGKVYIIVKVGGENSGIKTVNSFNDGLTHTAKYISNGSAFSIEVDGVLQAVTLTHVTNTGNWFGDVLSRDNLNIGAFSGGGVSAYFNGIISDIKIYDPSNTLVNQWDGYANTDAAWEDQVGTLDMTRVNTYNAYLVARLDTPAIDVGGNATQWQGSTYPVLPNITGGTSEAFTAINTNVADDGDQTPAIKLAGLPVTWTQGDANTPRFQTKDNSDSTSSLALGLPSDPTTEEQISIDKYHE